MRRQRQEEGYSKTAAEGKSLSLMNTVAWAAVAATVSYLVGYNAGELPFFPLDSNSRVVGGQRMADQNTSHSRRSLLPASPSADWLERSGCTVHKLLADEEVPGMHLLCVVRTRHHLSATVYRDGQNATVAHVKTGLDWLEFREGLQQKLNMSEGPTRVGRIQGGKTTPNTRQPWAMFTPQGDRITCLEHMAEGGNDVIVYEGGSFIWPGVRPGHVTVIERAHGMKPLQMETVSLRPLVFTVDGFLQDVECDHIRVRGEPRLEQSGVSLMDHDKGKPATDWRTSATTFLTSKGDPVLELVDRRVRDLTRQPLSHQESVQLLRYQLTQRYDAHHDYFDERQYSDRPTRQLIDNGRRNRMATILWYLSDVASGGETIFPMANGHPEPLNKRNCDMMGGIRVRPKQGRVILFYSLLPNGDLDDNSLHASCAVKEGVKWAANKWVWNQPIKHIMG